MTTDTSPSLAPGWYADPAGRHEHRYWDGAAWTGRVADSGKVSVDKRLAAATSISPPTDDTAKHSTRGGSLAGDVFQTIYGAIAGAAVTTAWTAPLVAGVATATVFYGWRPLSQSNSVEVGVVSGLVVWGLLAIILSPVVASPAMESESWDSALMRRGELRARLIELEREQCNGRANLDEARADVGHLHSKAFLRPGLRWATRSGHIALWRRIHRAEEALLPCVDLTDLWQAVQRARLQLDGASIALSTRLTTVIDDIARFLASHPPAGRLDAGAAFLRPPAPSGGSSLVASQPTDLGLPPVSSEEDARGRLRQATAAINSFRDDKWAALVRIRNQTLAALSLTALLTYSLLALAVAYGVDRNIVTTAIVYFLVAATVGFLSRLMTLSSTTDAIDDYGLRFARLLIVPVVSGLAGLGGVLLIAMLFSTGFSSLVQAGASGSSMNPGGNLPNLSDVFNLGTNRAGLLIAIVFGYAPALLMMRLDTLVESYKAEIKSTEPAQGSSAASGGS